MAFPTIRSSPPVLSALESSGPIALFLDFDGTLVELAQTPDAIQPRHRLAESLLALCDRLNGRLALVSGRAIDDLRRHLGHLPITMAGSHGGAIENQHGDALGSMPQGIGDDVLDHLREFAAQLGIDLEEKTHGAALHFRSAPELEERAHTFANTLASQNNLTAKHGKCVVELVENNVDKGRAVKTIMADPAFAGSTPWFIGDDITDEDGFAACINLGGGAVLVGERENSYARYALPSVAAVHHWLEFE